VLVLVVSGLAGYAFARYRFPRQELLFTAILALMMLPGALTLIPLSVQIASRGWINSVHGIALPALAKLAILDLLFTWNDLIWPLVVTVGYERLPVSVAVLTFDQEFLSPEYGVAYAGYIISIVPLSIVFALTAVRQRISGDDRFALQALGPQTQRRQPVHLGAVIERRLRSRRILRPAAPDRHRLALQRPRV